MGSLSSLTEEIESASKNDDDLSSIRKRRTYTLGHYHHVLHKVHKYLNDRVLLACVLAAKDMGETIRSSLPRA